jgi:hypothetical protein
VLFYYFAVFYRAEKGTRDLEKKRARVLKSPHAVEKIITSILPNFRALKRNAVLSKISHAEKTLSI